MFRRLLREPLIHFAALALLIFAAYFALTPRSHQTRAEGITVTAAKIDQLAAVFARTWQRPPSPEELKGLIDDHVKEEIYVREALTLGLDRDDTVIRRRLRQKMEFMTDADVDALIPSDAELAAYLARHPERFAFDPLIAFKQVFLSPDRRGDAITADADTLLERARADPAADLAMLGDASLLPAEMPPSTQASISGVFGPDFADAVARAEPGAWTGPVVSAFGLHLVQVTERRPGRAPQLAEIRDAVLREWSNDQRVVLEDQRVKAMLDRYRVTIETVPAAGSR